MTNKALWKRRRGDKRRFLCQCKKTLITVDTRKENVCNSKNVGFMRSCTESKKTPVLTYIRKAYSKSKLNGPLGCILFL